MEPFYRVQCWIHSTTAEKTNFKNLHLTLYTIASAHGAPALRYRYRSDHGLKLGLFFRNMLLYAQFGTKNNDSRF